MRENKKKTVPLHLEMTYTIEKIATLTGAHRFGDTDANIGWLLTDSRSLTFPEETLFFALKTERNDGGRYIGDLYARGVRNFTVQELPEKWQEKYPDANFLKVTDTLEALQRLAERHRDEFNIPVVGITGSNGKTIVKEWLYQLLAGDYPAPGHTGSITRSPRSYNSQIGVPLSIWLLHEQSAVGIFEAGISLKGEMERLQTIIQPDIVVITNIGSAHQENFSSMEEKCIEKLKLVHNAKVLIFNADDETLRKCIDSPDLQKVEKTGWSKQGRKAEITVKATQNADGTHVEMTLNEPLTMIPARGKQAQLPKGTSIAYNLPFIDEASVDDSISAAITALSLSLAPDVIERKMPALEPVAMRLEVKEGQRGCTIINDSYNNDIKSLDIALDFMNRRTERNGSTHTLILSDIYQSGLTPKELYRQVGALIKEREIDKFIGIGKEISDNASLIPVREKYFFKDTQSFIASHLIQGLSDEVILIKGARNFGFDRITDLLELKVHETVLEVNLTAVADNLNYYRSFLKPETKITCMIKADGYGAGAVEIAKTLQDRGVEYLAVAVADEGATLRRNGIKANIMVMNPEMSSFKTLFDYELEPEVYSFRILDAIIKAARKEGITGYPIHLKLNTGMNRLGFEPDKDIDELISRLKDQNAVTPRSIFSHFVGSDSDSFDEFSKQQFDIFDKASRKIQQAFSHKIIRHICNSAGIEHFPQYQLDMCRLGLGLYGINPRNNNIINNVCALKTTILQIHDVDKDATVGYSRKGTLTRNSRIAKIPIGYADGLNRHLGNRHCYCLVNGQKAPYVGNICMDVAMIDVTDIDCHEGDTVEIFGDNLPVTVLSDVLETIPYEVLTLVSNRVKRIYFEN